MVDYKNVERIRELYSQLNSNDRFNVYNQLIDELKEETEFRKKQGLSVSIEPTTSWNSVVENLIKELETGNVHPDIFKNAEGHPKDPFYPDTNFSSMPPPKFLYDIWCQIMVRSLIIARGTYDIENIMKLESPENLNISGALISFKGIFNGNIVYPHEHENIPISYSTLTIHNDKSVWTAKLGIKTHYIYSTTASDSLSKGEENGILIFRGIDKMELNASARVVKFFCSPLIIGSGALKLE